ncbi:serine hydrolase domain-containing protein [Candidatus Bipolaricaulota bacterium]
MKTLLWIALGLGVAAGLVLLAAPRFVCQTSDTRQPVLTPELLADFEAYVEQMRGILNVPGAAVAIVQGGEIVYAEGFGVKEAGRDAPVTADTVFSIGSTTKSMTAMMIASLVDDGLVEWDTPLVEVMLQFQLSDEQATQQITLREALGMTTGLPKLGLFAFSERSPEDYVEYISGVPLAASPGESYVYHNEMYAVGAYAATMAAGAGYGENLFSTYAELMQERVFDPLGMASATFSAQEAAASADHATPHVQSLNATMGETGPDVAPTDFADTDAIAPAGTARMSVRDVGRFLITMLSGGIAPDGTRAISTENLAETWTERVSVDPFPHIEQDGYGMGWHLATFQGIPLVTHNGSISGFSSEMAFIPTADTGIVVLANADYLGATFRTQILFRLIEMLFGLETFMDAGFAEAIGAYLDSLSDGYSQLAPVDPQAIQPFLGNYEWEGAVYTVELREERLWVAIGEWDYIELLAAPDGTYVAISGGDEFIGAPFQFVETDDGRITVVIYGALEVPKLE